MLLFSFILIWIVGILLLLVYRGYRRYNGDNYYLLGNEIFEIVAFICWPILIPGSFIFHKLIFAFVWLADKLDDLGRKIADKNFKGE